MGIKLGDERQADGRVLYRKALVEMQGSNYADALTAFKQLEDPGYNLTNSSPATRRQW